MKFQALPGYSARGFLVYVAMRSYALPSDHYGDPLEAYAAKQAREARKAAQKAAQPAPKRPILTLKRPSVEGWSPKRQAAEALFDLPPRRSRSNGA